MDTGQAIGKETGNTATPRLTDFAGIADETERGKLQVDLYKLRAQEYCGRYEDARDVEWKTLFQVYAAYAGLAIAFRYAFQEGGAAHPKLISSLAIGATLIFYGASRYLNYRVQERLITFNETRENYLAQLDAAFHIPKATPGTDDLGDRYFWTFRTHLVLSTLTFVSLLGYETSKGLVNNAPPWVILFLLPACAILLACALVFIGCKCVPK